MAMRWKGVACRIDVEIQRFAMPGFSIIIGAPVSAQQRQHFRKHTLPCQITLLPYDKVRPGRHLTNPQKPVVGELSIHFFVCLITATFAFMDIYRGSLMLGRFVLLARQTAI